MKACESVKKDFQKELLNTAQLMTEEEIGSAVVRLMEYRVRNFQSDVRERHELAAYCEGCNEAFRAEVGFIGEGRNKQGSMILIGVSLLDETDYKALSEVTIIWDEWWLRDGSRAKGFGKVAAHDRNANGYLRPVIIIDTIKGNIKSGDHFYINYERFRLISDHLAIRSSVLEGIQCETPRNTKGWRYCIEGWYLMMIRENPKWCEINGLSCTA